MEVHVIALGGDRERRLSARQLAKQDQLAETTVRRFLRQAKPTPPKIPSGARSAEVAQLKVRDIDSQRLLVRIQGGKGRKDRDVMLSPVLLEALREHWRQLKPRVRLFPGGRGHKASQPIGTKTVWHACSLAARRAGLKKRVHPHTLRHCFAPPLPEASADLRTIRVLLGHRDWEETTVYLRLSSRHLRATASPLDSWALATSAKKDDPAAGK